MGARFLTVEEGVTTMQGRTTVNFVVLNKNWSEVYV